MKITTTAIQTENPPKRGFTLIELIIVIAILAVLAAIATPMMSNWIDDAKSSRAKTEINLIAKAAVAAYADECASINGATTDILYNTALGGWIMSGNAAEDLIVSKFIKSFEYFIDDDTVYDKMTSLVLRSGGEGYPLFVQIIYTDGGVRYTYNSQAEQTFTEEKIS